MSTEIQEFREYGDEVLNNHILELHTVYNNLRPMDNSLMLEAYNQHRKILSKELAEEIDRLIDVEDPWLKDILLAIKKKYEENLIWKTSMNTD